jgi:hypothetical protein
MKVDMLLADYAAAAEGKMTVVGGGWNVAGPGPMPFAVPIWFHVPWHMTNEKIRFQLELIDPDGTGVVPVGADEPLVIQGEFEVGRPPGAPKGMTFPFPVPLNSGGPVALPPGGHYEFRLLVNGETREDWRLAFWTRDEAQSMAA